MEFFLEKIAASSYKKYGNSLNRHCFVFPNRRAGIFFLKYLSSAIERPVWAPEVMTVTELFRSYSGLNVAEYETLLFDLYRVYRKIMKSPEPFDSFLFWGDILLNDFDDIDKYLVNNSALYENLSDIKDIDSRFGSLTDSQIAIIRQFWINFNPEKPTGQKKDFINLWNSLENIYSEYRCMLKSKNTAYEGMIFREVAENANSLFETGLRWDTVHFAGFNALNECEKKVMTALKGNGAARFYWDYDNSYVYSQGYNSAGYFMKSNIAAFGNDMPEEWNCETLLSGGGQEKAKRTVISASSDVAQVKAAMSVLENMQVNSHDAAHETAVVLSDEKLLVPVLSSLPQNTGDVNITMGYPLRQTAACMLVNSIASLQQNARTVNGVACFHYADVLNILKNKTVSDAFSSAAVAAGEIESGNMASVPETFFAGSSGLNTIFSRPQGAAQYSSYIISVLSAVASGHADDSEDLFRRRLLNEQFYRIALTVNRLGDIVSAGDIEFSGATYMRLLERMLSIQTIPFYGEPLSGVQIMGILETRALDFKNIIILSVNEGIMPSVSSPASSCIPFSLREAFGLPSVNHQESIYAYHFFRLLHRAENVTFIYNSNTDGLRSGEISRFLTQMNFNPALKPETFALYSEIKSQAAAKHTVERTASHQAKLMQVYSEENRRALSPSAINTWLHCRMKFYYRYVCSLCEPAGIKTDIDAAMLGLMLHDTMKSIYEHAEGKAIDKSFIESVIHEKQYIKDKIETSVASIPGFRLSGTEDDGAVLIVKEALFKYIVNILMADTAFMPLKILGLEKQAHFTADANTANGKFKVTVGGIVDRIDIQGNTVRVVDYKTGDVSQSITSVSELFNDDRKKEHDGWLQTLIYCEALYGKTDGLPVRPSIYRIRKTAGQGRNDMLLVKTGKTQHEINDYSEIRTEFIAGLSSVVNLIFDEHEPFSMTSGQEIKCRYCAYRTLCMR
ncbi:MAG: PD-(D/E)XK nuclease family protein [Bacteroidales bacterium]|jgi:hypothetical protein|nr:PD-(D/E)XK nuclease family protein [Bacteroidales bacterium]